MTSENKEEAKDGSSLFASGLHSDQNLRNSRRTHLGSSLDFENPERKFGVNGENELGSPKDDSFDVKINMGVLNKGVAPWAHGATSGEGFKFHGDDEHQNHSCSRNEETVYNLNALSVSTEERPDFDRSGILPQAETSIIDLRDDVRGPVMKSPLQTEKSSVSFIVDELKNSLGENNRNRDDGNASDEVDNAVPSNYSRDVVKLRGTVRFPWERDNGGNDEEGFHRRSNTEFAEKTIPEPELRRLRNVALRMKERMKVGPAGVTEALVENIHKKWEVDEVVKLWFEGPPTLHMKRTHEILERKTGGLVIWRSGRSVVLYRGMAYELPCVKSYAKLTDTDSNHKTCPSIEPSTSGSVSSTNDYTRISKLSEVSSSLANSPGGFANGFDIDSFLDQLGPRYKDWSGCNPLPVDADMLPGVVPGYTPPFRLLPYKTRSALKNRQMTSLRRLARTMSPHFVLGRNRQHEGLARAMAKLWEKSSLAKIAIKRGVPNTCNERMAEEIKKLTGGVLLSRNKEYIVFYRGNDFVTPSVREVLVEKQKQATVYQDEEEAARLRAAALIASNTRTDKGPRLAGTLAETLEANNCWGRQPSTEEREKLKRDLTLAKHASLVRYLERKLAFAKAKVRKAERALAKVQELLNPAELPTDLETVTDEERFLFRNMGLKMRAYLHLGRREVFDGTVQNMHLQWKHRELVKILVKGKRFAQVKHIAISLEAESGGVLISLDKTTKGYAIVVYRGKNYQRPQSLRPKNLLTRRQALARAIELQRREALNHHISNLHERIEMLKSQLSKMKNDNELGDEQLDVEKDDTFHSDEDMDDEDEEAYLETYVSSDEDGDDASTEEL